MEGITDADLNRAAIEGFISALGSKVSLEGGETRPTRRRPGLRSHGPGFLITISLIFALALSAGAAKAVRTAYDHLASSNKLKGVVLDLRYTDGNDYAGAAAVADLFILKETAAAGLGQRVVRSKAKTTRSPCR